MRLGFVGAGRMGRPMVRRLVAAGHDVRVLARRADARAKLAAEGAQVVCDPADAADRADALFVCVFGDEQVREVCLDGPVLGQMPAGSVLVVHTTANPGTVRTIAESCAASRALRIAAASGSVATLLGSIAEFVRKDVGVVRRVAAEVGGDLGAIGWVLDTPTGADLHGGLAGAAR